MSNEAFGKHMVWTVDPRTKSEIGIGYSSLVEAQAEASKLEQVPFTFARMSRPFLRLMKDRHLRLTNHVDVRNALAIRWLRWLGFTLDPAAPAGPFGFMFHHFWMEA